MKRLIQAINNQQEELNQLIQNHNELCERFARAEKYFSDENIPVDQKILHKDRVIRLMKDIEASIQSIRRMGYTLTKEEEIRGVIL